MCKVIRLLYGLTTLHIFFNERERRRDFPFLIITSSLILYFVLFDFLQSVHTVLIRYMNLKKMCKVVRLFSLTTLHIYLYEIEKRRVSADLSLTAANTSRNL